MRFQKFPIQKPRINDNVIRRYTESSRLGEKMFSSNIALAVYY